MADSKYHIIRQGDTDSSYLIKSIIDKENDIKDVPTSWLPGSTAYAIDTGRTFILNGQQVWQKQKNTGSAGDISTEILDAAIESALERSYLYTDQAIDTKAVQTTFVKQLPSAYEGIKENTIYFVPRTSLAQENRFFEYMYIQNEWELIGQTSLELSNYWTISQIKEYVNSEKYKLPIASTATLGVVKIGENSPIQVQEDGTLIINEPHFQQSIENKVDETLSKSTASNTDIENLFK